MEYESITGFLLACGFTCSHNAEGAYFYRLGLRASVLGGESGPTTRVVAVALLSRAQLTYPTPSISSSLRGERAPQKSRQRRFKPLCERQPPDEGGLSTASTPLAPPSA